MQENVTKGHNGHVIRTRPICQRRCTTVARTGWIDPNHRHPSTATGDNNAAAPSSKEVRRRGPRRAGNRRWHRRRCSRWAKHEHINAHRGLDAWLQHRVVVPATPAKQDVSSLINATLPGVVSISVVLNGGQGAGTGFIISSDGQIATNAHVVADASKIDVKFADGTTAPATVQGVDRTDDLAVVKVSKAGLTALPLGKSSDLKIGEPVVAIGNALDLTGGPTATEGIVSALNRTIDTSDGEHLTHLLQTDAAINPGNSGGPLLTLDGKVVGINSAGSRHAQNIGFAIAIDTARPIVQQLQQGKTVTKAYLGVTTTVVDANVAARAASTSTTAC